ncbi:MAG TPA: hypothetical protein VLA52_09665 [Thermohalobaculum sp.]|nr:hypothetical protein [Thermohalobaculum sp.]
MNGFREFLLADDGAITIDWVALTSGLLLMGIAVIYAIFNTGVASAVSQINTALGAITIVGVGTAPDFTAQLSDPVVVVEDLVLPDGTTIPSGSTVTSSTYETSHGTNRNIVEFETPDGTHVTVVSYDPSGDPPPTDSTVTSGTTVTSAQGDVYDMGDYTTAPAGEEA